MKTPRSLLAYLGSTLVCLSALAAGNASAATLSLNSWTLGESVKVVSAGRTGTVNTAELKLSLGGNSGFGYCVDLAQDITAGTTSGWTTSAASSSDQVIRAAWLVDNFQPNLDAMIHPLSDTYSFAVTKQTAIAALQVAIWEVMAEAPGDYNLYAGAFALSQASDGVMNLSRDFLGQLNGADLSGYQTSAIWAVSRTQQDQLFFGRVNPIPEPNTVALYGIGAVLIAYALRRQLI